MQVRKEEEMLQGKQKGMKLKIVAMAKCSLWPDFSGPSTTEFTERLHTFMH